MDLDQLGLQLFHGPWSLTAGQTLLPMGCTVAEMFIWIVNVQVYRSI